MEENSTKTILVGLMAYGMSGKVFHAPFFNAHTGFNLKAVTERSKKKAQLEYPSVISYNSINELLNDTEIDLVVVNTPNNLHYQHTKLALERGKHVLVEKPFTATSAQARELFELAHRMGKSIFFYQNRRWDSDFIAVKKVIESGKLGKLNEVYFRFDRYRNSISPKAFKEEAVEASGLLFDLGPHLLDQVISLFGKPISHYKIIGKNRPNTVVDDFFTVQLSYPNSLHVFVTASMLVANPQAAFVLHGVNGSFIKHRTDIQEEQLVAGLKLNDKAYGLEAQGGEGLLTTIDAEGLKKEEQISSERGNYLPLFEAIYQSLIAQQPYPITQEDILTQIEILES